MHQIEDMDIDLRRRTRSPYGVGLVEEIIAGGIVHNSRVADLRYIVHKMHMLLGMLVKVFLVCMQHWITNMKTTKHL